MVLVLPSCYPLLRLTFILLLLGTRSDHGAEATQYLRAFIGEHYHYSEKPVFKALWDNYNECQFVEDTGNVARTIKSDRMELSLHFIRRKHSFLSQQKGPSDPQARGEVSQKHIDRRICHVAVPDVIAPCTASSRLRIPELPAVAVASLQSLAASRKSQHRSPPTRACRRVRVAVVCKLTPAMRYVCTSQIDSPP